MNQGSIFLAGLIAGAIAGLAAGVLLAPKPGKETRELIVNRADDLRGRAEGYVEGVRTRLQGDKEEETT